jgi:hypothetical protein
MGTERALCDVRPSSDLNFNNTRCMNDALIGDCYILWILASVAISVLIGVYTNPENLEPPAHEYIAKSLRRFNSVLSPPHVSDPA